MTVRAIAEERGGAIFLRPTPGIELFGLAQYVRNVVADTAAVRVRDGAVRVSLRNAQDLRHRPDAVIEWPAALARYVDNRATRIPVTSDVAVSHEFRQLAVVDLRERLKDSRMIGLLDDHQVLNVAIMTITESYGACVFDEQGTGKTVSLIGAFDLLVERNQADVLLVVAPKSMVGEWGAEIARFTDRLYRVQALEGTRHHKAGQLHSGADVYVCNYETVMSLADDLRLLCERKRVVIAVDESFNIKNPDAVRTAAVAALREWCIRAYALCGTPAPNRADDVIAQVTFVDLGRAFDGIRLPDDNDERRTRIREILDGSVVYTRNLKLAVLPDLPSRTFTEVPVTMGKGQRGLYDSIAGDLIVELQTTTSAQFASNYTHFLARRAALLRACSDPSGVDPAFSGTPAKILALDQLLARWIDSGEKVIIWSFYRSTLDALEKRFSPYGVARIDGSISSSADRRAAVASFQTDDATRVFVGNPAAAGAGITLHRAAITVYESMSNQAAHYLQSLDRTHRRGQQRDVEYVTLICDNTIEAAEYLRLKTKAAAQADLLGDPTPELFTREMMLDELLAGLADGGDTGARS